MGHPVVMGRKTFESLPSGILPGRKNIVFTGTPDANETADYTEVNSLEKMFDACPDGGEIFIIGGASLYRQFMELADLLYITWIHNVFEADTFFPEIDFAQWKETARENFEADEKNAFSCSFVTYKKIK
jgi:dihydrofolate reductase